MVVKWCMKMTLIRKVSQMNSKAAFTLHFANKKAWFYPHSCVLVEVARQPDKMTKNLNWKIHLWSEIFEMLAEILLIMQCKRLLSTHQKMMLILGHMTLLATMQFHAEQQHIEHVLLTLFFFFLLFTKWFLGLCKWTFYAEEWGYPAIYSTIFFLLIVLSNLSSSCFNQSPAHIILQKIWIPLFSFAILYEAYRGNNIYEWVILL